MFKKIAFALVLAALLMFAAPMAINPPAVHANGFVRTVIPIQAPTQFGGLQNVVLTAADAANNHIIANDGRTVIIAVNNDAAAKTVTISSVPDENGRTGDIVMVVPAAAGGFPGIGITDTLPPALFSQQNADAGNIYLQVSAATSLKLAAVRIP